MNDTMIEAMSQFEILRSILRSDTPGPSPAPCASSAVSMDTVCNTLTVATAITW